MEEKRKEQIVKTRDELKVRGEDLLKKVRELVHQGNIRRIIIKNEEGRTYLEIPLTIGLVGAFLAPVWAAIGALAAVAVNFRIEVLKKEDEDSPAGPEQLP